MAELTFLGAARTVTGSKYLLDAGGSRVLVDCGLFQGLKALRERNWEPFPVPPASIDAVVVTHAHLDHVGYLPRLVADGFRGVVFCTAGTAELSRLVLPDSARIQEEDAKQANKHGYTRHTPALPLYREEDAFRALSQMHPVGYGRTIDIAQGVTVEFSPAGHLLGSSFLTCTIAGGKRILFGGDLGRYGRPVLPDPAAGVAADVALVESTYGDRDHESDDKGEALAAVIRETAERKGKLIIPAFAIGRVEEVLYWVRRLEREGRIPVLPVFVDSPMATEALKFYTARVAELDPDMRPSQKEVSTFATARFQTVSSPQQSKQLTASRRSALILSSSGMATGAASSITWPRRCPTRKIQSCSSGTKPTALAGGRSWTARRRYGSTAARFPSAHESRGSTPCPHTPIGARSCGGLAPFRPLRPAYAWCTASPARWTPSKRRSSGA